MYECEYCGKVIDCMHRREAILIANSPICQNNHLAIKKLAQMHKDVKKKDKET